MTHTNARIPRMRAFVSRLGCYLALGYFGSQTLQ